MEFLLAFQLVAVILLIALAYEATKEGEFLWFLLDFGLAVINLSFAIENILELLQTI